MSSRHYSLCLKRAARYTRAIDGNILYPGSPEELAHALADAASQRLRIRTGGRFSKSAMAGPLTPADVTISTCRLTRVIQYEPRDLTLSVEAGARFQQVSQMLAAHGQMIPLDPPFAEEATIGGVLAANCSGPRRRLYGTARDLVIGMTFATVEGKLIRTGGMVVKNVAGLDMAKPMIGSFGTLAVIATVNFKLHPISAATRTFIQEFDSASRAIAARNVVLGSVLQPAAIDIEKHVGGYRLLIQAGGSPAVLDRYSALLPEAGEYDGDAEASQWRAIREMAPEFLTAHPQGAVVRIGCKLSEVGATLEALPVPAIARAGSGIVYGCFEEAHQALGLGLIEFAPQSFRERNELWNPGGNFAMMKKVKDMFDPQGLLNRGRLYGRI